MSSTNYLVVITTCASGDEAARIASELVNKRLAACVQLDGIRSIYRWQDKVETADEIRLMIKAKAEDYPEIEAFIKSTHSYANPEVISVPISSGSQLYLDWISDETKREIE